MQKLDLFSDPGGIRTLDPLIKSQLLYQLSYGVVCNFRYKDKLIFRMVKPKLSFLLRKNKPCDHLQQGLYFGDSAGIRTQDPILKRDVLYLLSY